MTTLLMYPSLVGQTAPCRIQAACIPHASQCAALSNAAVNITNLDLCWLQVASVACTCHGAAVELESIIRLAIFPEWTMDGLIWQGRNGQALAAVGLSNNSVAVYQQAAGAGRVCIDPAAIW